MSTVVEAPARATIRARASHLRGMTMPIFAFGWSVFFAGATAACSVAYGLHGRVGSCELHAFFAVVNAACAIMNLRELHRTVLGLVGSSFDAGFEWALKTDGADS